MIFSFKIISRYPFQLETCHGEKPIKEINILSSRHHNGDEEVKWGEKERVCRANTTKNETRTQDINQQNTQFRGKKEERGVCELQRKGERRKCASVKKKISGIAKKKKIIREEGASFSSLSREGEERDYLLLV